MKFTDPPGEPKDVEIAKFDRSSVSLKWKEPTDDGGDPIEGMCIGVKKYPRIGLPCVSVGITGIDVFCSTAGYQVCFI